MKAGWTDVALKEVAALVRDVIEPSAIADGTLYVGLENIERGGSFTNVGPVANGELASAKFTFDSSHILYGKLRPNLGKVARPRFAGVCSTDILPIAPGSRIDRNYLAHFLLRPATVELAAQRATGANLPRLAPTELMRFHLPLPPLDEQRRIAGVLDLGDSLWQVRARSIDLLGRLVVNFFDRRFGGATTSRYRTAELRTVCSRISDGTHQPPEWAASGVPFLFVRNIVGGEIDWTVERYISGSTHHELTRRSPIEVGDVLYSTVGSYGVPAVVRSPRKFAFQRHIAHLKPDRDVVDPEFLAAAMASTEVRRQADRAARGVAQKTLNLSDIQRFTIPVPAIAEQRSFAAALSKIRDVRLAMTSHLEYLDTLRSSSRYRAFNGEL